MANSRRCANGSLSPLTPVRNTANSFEGEEEARRTTKAFKFIPSIEAGESRGHNKRRPAGMDKHFHLLPQAQSSKMTAGSGVVTAPRQPPPVHQRLKRTTLTRPTERPSTVGLFGSSSCRSEAIRLGFARRRQQPSTTTSGALWCAFLLSTLISVIAVGQYFTLASAQESGSNGSTQQQQLLASPTSNQQQSSHTTKAYAEPIKWSWGGWAPLEGAPKGAANGSRIDPAAATGAQQATSPLPLGSQQRTTARPSGAAHSLKPSPQQPFSGNQSAAQRPGYNGDSSRHQGAPEALSESASSARENVQFAGVEPQHHGGGQHMMSNHQRPQHQLHTGPAYALPMLASRPPAQFSPPAPMPIVREQLLPPPGYHNQSGPPAPGHRQARPLGPGYPTQMNGDQHFGGEGPLPGYAQHMHAMQQQQQGIRMRPSGNFYRQQQQHMQHNHHRHQQQMAFHQQQQHHMHQAMMAQHNQQQQPSGHHLNQARPRGRNMNYQQQQQPQQAFSRPPMESGQQQRSIPHYPGSPLMHKNQAQNDQQQVQVQAQPPVASYKLLEGEQPIMFNSALPNERIPMIEVSAGGGSQLQVRYKNESAPHAHHNHHHLNNQQQVSEHADAQQTRPGPEQQQQQQQQAAYSLPSPDNSVSQLYSSTLAAIEKDNLNYQSALNQVNSNYANEEQRQQHQQQSNNIQDIKEKQQYDQGGSRSLKQLNDKDNAAKATPVTGPKAAPGQVANYLTIPVAVETEGDKVLTPDDINEIEKHVINVLPNLKTADKIVKIADAQLTLANIKGSSPVPSNGQQASGNNNNEHPGQSLHQVNYEEHRSTLKQLEGDLKQQQQREYSQSSANHVAPEPPTTAAYGGASSVGSMNQASTADVQHQPVSSNADAAAAADLVQQQKQHEHDQQQQQLLAEHQYFVATGPLQEIGTVDPDQLADYNLIKNDLLNNFRYEPTRAHSAHSGHRQQAGGASTPPMPYAAASQTPAPPTIQHGAGVGGETPSPALQMPYSRPAAPGGGQFSVTRYFHQGASALAANGHKMPNRQRGHHHQHQHQQHFGRIPGRGGNSYGQAHTSTTKTIMGGRKVSEVMRPLIHTTPVPMTSPIHVPSVEPEKVDAIQLIAGHANDRQPMVVEAHQLVNHTPDGGIDYNSGMAMQQQQQRAQNQSYAFVDAPAQQQQQPQEERQVEYNPQQQQQQQQQPQHETGDNQGAIIEYVALADQGALANAVARQTAGGQGYEIATGEPEVQTQYVGGEQQQHQMPHQRPLQHADQQVNNQQAPFLYDYTVSTTQQQVSPGGESVGEGATGAPQPTPPTYMITTNGAQLLAHHQQHQQQQTEPQPSLAWSPSVASEHQQQQAELNEQVGAMQQVDLPATAGYNFFGQQEQQQQLTTTSATAAGQEYEQQQDQRQQRPEQSRWRTKAGGSQPNPDAQYDGQIAKGDQQQQDQEAQNNHEQQAEEQPGQQQYANYGGQQQQQPQQQQQTVELVRLPANSNSRPPHEAHEGQGENGNEQANDSAYQQAHLQAAAQYHEQQASMSTPASADGQQQPGDGYLSTNSYVGGAQLNHPTPSNNNNNNENYEQQQQQQYAQPQQSAPTTRFSYMKLDRDRQQTHLAQHQAQHQAQLAEIMESQQPNYQTTTPMTLTTLAAIEQQQEAANQQQQQQNTQQQEQDSQQQQQQQQNGNNNNGYMVEQVQSRPSVQSPPDSMLINESPLQVPILDQQSLISDPNQDSNDEFSDDDGAKQRQQSQPAGVYQVYQAYYAPKDHKPLPGYVRLSLEEFNELFRDAEIQYVDRNLNGLANHIAQNGGEISQMANSAMNSANAYEQQQRQGEPMKASASENQSIVVDRRSLSERRSSSSSALNVTEPIDQRIDSAQTRKLNLGSRAIKKIISIRNSRQLAKQQAKANLKRGGSSSSDLEAAASTTSTSNASAAAAGAQVSPAQDAVNTGNIESVEAQKLGKQRKQAQQTIKRKAEGLSKKVTTQQPKTKSLVQHSLASEGDKTATSLNDKKTTKLVQ